MILLVICVFVLLIVLVVLALSQVSDLNKRITAYLRELNKIVGLESRLERLEREMSGLRSPAGGATAQPGPPARVGMVPPGMGGLHRRQTA